MRPLVLALAVCVIACTHSDAPPPRWEANASLCACRVICSPDGYEWTLTYVGPATPGGVCKCVGARER